jgi:hypothetical protein
MRRFALVVGVLALGLLGCGKIMPGESGIRGRVPVGADWWVPVPGEEICASTHERSSNPICAKVKRDGSFELALPSDTYWLCTPDLYSGVSCPSLCPYPVSGGEVTVVEPADLSTPTPEGQGFYGTSRGSFGERGYLDVRHPLRICVGPPDTPFVTPISKLTCVETDRCGRYVLSVPEGSYRLLFAEVDEEVTSDRQDCLYRVTAGQATRVDRVTGRGASGERAACDDDSTPDPITGAELAPMIRELAGIDPDEVPPAVRVELVQLARTRLSAGTSMEQLAEELQVDFEWLLSVVSALLAQDHPELRLMIPAVITTDERHIAYPISSMEYENKNRVTLRGSNFFGERGKVTLRRLDTQETIEITSHRLTWDSHEVSFDDGLPSGSYEVSVSRPDGAASYPPQALVLINVPRDIVVSPPRPKPTGAPEGSEPLAIDQLKAALDAVQPAVLACASKHDAPSGQRIDVHFTLHRPDVVMARLVRIEQAATRLGLCVEAAAKTAAFPTLHDDQMSFTYSFIL